MGERAEENRKNGGTLYITVIVALMLLAVIVGLSVFFNIETIEVEGASAYSAAEIIEASGIETDGSIFFLNDSAAAVRIKNAFAYVDEVQIVKTLPGTVTIRVTETPPVAWFESAGSYWVVSSQTKILERTDSITSRNLAELRGIEPIMPAVGDYISLGESGSVKLGYLTSVLRELDRAGMSGKVAWLDMTNLSAVSFFYDNRFTVLLGRADEVQDKLWLMKKIADLHPGERNATINLVNYPEGHYIRDN